MENIKIKLLKQISAGNFEFSQSGNNFQVTPVLIAGNEHGAGGQVGVGYSINDNLSVSVGTSFATDYNTIGFNPSVRVQGSFPF